MVLKVQSGLSGVLRPFQGVYKVKIIFATLRYHLPLSQLVKISKVDVACDSSITSKTKKQKRLMQKFLEKNTSFQ